MGEMEVWMWLILAVIGITAIAKISTLIMGNGDQTGAQDYRESHQERPAAGGAVIIRPDIQETGTMVYFANDHHGRTDKEYQFNYKKIDGEWRAYILRMPSLGSRDSSGLVTHRLYDGAGDPYVCWDRPVRSLKDMQAISRVWADSIQEYIATGKTFG